MRKAVAIVTGASRGVGKELAIHLSKKYFVILVARNEARLIQVANEIHSAGGEAIYFRADVADSKQVRVFIDEIVSKHQRIDLLINNAAILKRGTTDLPDEEIDELLNINLKGAVYVAKYVAQQMKIQREGYIINLSSLGGKVAMSFSGIYAASKFGLSGFSEALAKEMSLYNVKVTTICPSIIATEMATGRKFTVDEMIQINDIVKSVDYLLSLSKNALPTELLISCLSLIKKTTESITQLYLK
jgi:short-subunit dehydrogenase